MWYTVWMHEQVWETKWTMQPVCNLLAPRVPLSFTEQCLIPPHLTHLIDGKYWVAIATADRFLLQTGRNKSLSQRNSPKKPLYHIKINVLSHYLWFLDEWVAAVPPTSFLNVLIEKVLLSIEAVRLESFDKDDLALFWLSLVVLPAGRLP